MPGGETSGVFDFEAPPKPPLIIVGGNDDSAVFAALAEELCSEANCLVWHESSEALIYALEMVGSGEIVLASAAAALELPKEAAIRLSAQPLVVLIRNEAGDAEEQLDRLRDLTSFELVSSTGVTSLVREAS